MTRKILLCAMAVLFLCSFWPATFTVAQNVAPLNASGLVKLGDKIRYGSYSIYKIGEGIYQINDNEGHQPDGILGALGVDMYLICGDNKALMIDLGNNYISGYAGDKLRPRANAAEEFRAMVYGLAGKRPVEFAITHMHPDHDGMTGALINRNATLWVSDGEDGPALTKQHSLDPSVYTRFTCGKKSFDLGGGRVVDTFLVRGHSEGGTVFILKKDLMIFTGDAFGSGNRSLSTGEAIKKFAEESQKFVDYIKANFSPFERYALKVCTGHTGPYGRTGLDIGYLDWRYIQNMCSCANGIVKGQWLVEGSGLRLSEPPANSRGASPGGVTQKQGVFTYGIGIITTPLEAAHEAAGLKMQK
jgi:glyoxylase-like metal-dependent hydrolase (beta-lactamase superfamily II)